MGNNVKNQRSAGPSFDRTVLFAMHPQTSNEWHRVAWTI
jgi:hypothetical protein